MMRDSELTTEGTRQDSALGVRRPRKEWSEVHGPGPEGRPQAGARAFLRFERRQSESLTVTEKAQDGGTRTPWEVV